MIEINAPLRRRRFRIAVVVSAVVWSLLILYATTPYYHRLTFDGNLIASFRHPVEVMVLTVAATTLSMWLWRWHKHDRVQRVVSSLTTEERERVLELLVHGAAAPAEKRKNRLEDDGETGYDPSWDEAGGQSRTGAR